MPNGSADDLSDQILHAALTCFQEVGVRRTSMDDIARAARVGRMTVFRRFESKERLAQLVLLQILAQTAESIQCTFIRAGDLETGLTEAIFTSVRELRDHPLFVKLMKTEPDTFLGAGTSGGVSAIALMRHSVAGWLGSSGGGPLSDQDAAMVAETTVRLGVSLILAPGGPIPLHDDDGMRAFIARYLVPGIARLATDP
ncbi:TetR/AcrR family transcriptional regulator [Mycobacterium sp.]|uniref:TetR/AcrR family transcriptional regulator n=1 Tax=Mycobacterium sp. TaxID=1785 RepID=UPI003A84C530